MRQVSAVAREAGNVVNIKSKKDGTLGYGGWGRELSHAWGL
jgi:hypothetical protein